MSDCKQWCCHVATSIGAASGAPAQAGIGESKSARPSLGDCSGVGIGRGIMGSPVCEAPMSCMTSSAMGSNLAGAAAGAEAGASNSCRRMSSVIRCVTTHALSWTLRYSLRIHFGKCLASRACCQMALKGSPRYALDAEHTPGWRWRSAWARARRCRCAGRRAATAGRCTWAAPAWTPGRAARRSAASAEPSGTAAASAGRRRERLKRPPGLLSAAAQHSLEVRNLKAWRCAVQHQVLHCLQNTQKSASNDAKVVLQHTKAPAGLSYSLRFGLLIGSCGEGELKQWAAC